LVGVRRAGWPGLWVLGDPWPGQVGATTHLGPQARVSPSTPNRARWTAAASREKSAATLVCPRTRARLPPCRRRIRVADLGFHLWSGGSVVSPPRRVSLGSAGPDKVGLVDADPDPATALGVRARGNQRAPGAGHAKGRNLPTSLDGSDGRDDPSGARHGPGFGLEHETVLGETAPWCDRGLDFGHDLRPGSLQIGQQAAGAVRGVTIDRQRRLVGDGRALRSATRSRKRNGHRSPARSAVK
jgi:hypothetical protein